MRALLSGGWLLVLIGLHLLSRTGLLPAVPHDKTFLFFFGLNMPTLVFAGFSRSSALKNNPAFRSPIFLLGMGLIVVNFMMCGTGANPHDWVMRLLTAQSLWLAWPAWWGASHPRGAFV